VNASVASSRAWIDPAIAPARALVNEVQVD
jgi:hypothetical protein